MAASVTGKVKVPLALELFGNFSSSGRPVLAKEVLERFRTEQEQEETDKVATADKEEASEAESTCSSNKEEADGEQVGHQGIFLKVYL